MFCFFPFEKAAVKEQPSRGQHLLSSASDFFWNTVTALPSVRWEKRTWARWNTKRPNKPGWKRPTRGSFAWWRSRKLTWKRRKRCWKPTSLHWRKVQGTWTVTTSWFHLRALRCKLPLSLLLSRSWDFSKACWKWEKIYWGTDQGERCPE